MIGGYSAEIKIAIFQSVWKRQRVVIKIVLKLRVHGGKNRAF